MTEESLHKFLFSTAQTISGEPGYKSVSTCIILPTRRSGRIFATALKDSSLKNSFLLPEIRTMSDFSSEYSGFSIPDKDVLLLELLQSYQKFWPVPVDFDEFNRWGQMMLSDFDEIDKYCVQAGLLFSVIRDEKLIEAQFSIEQELKEWIGQFWSQVKEEKAYERDFLLTWEVLGKVYEHFKAQLAAKGMAYEGMAYMETLRKIKEETITLPFKAIHFIGFNAFSTFEERLIMALSDGYEVHLHWDADDYYIENDFHEAGNFMRKYKKMFTAARHHWHQGQLLSAGRTFYLHAAPLTQGQALAAATIAEQPFEGTTAIVLCEDSLQEAVLHALKNPGEVNLTMGKKIGQSPLSDLLFLLFRITITERCNRKELEKLTSHPYLPLLFGHQQAEHLRNWIKHHPAFYIPLKDVAAQSGKHQHLFANTQDITEVMQLWLKVIDIMFVSVGDKDNDLKAILLTYQQAIQHQQKRLAPYLPDISLKSAFNLLRAAIKGLTVPYDSDQSSNIQVMGFLETRLLDFDRVIIVGANEDVLPASKRGNSYIPYNLRRVFGLPTLQEYDGVYAYHFFRLLQRSKETHLIYNNVQGDAPFEKSRFLEQILLELNTPENRIFHRSWAYPTTQMDIPTETISIAKRPEHIQRLMSRSFSQTALALYLKCPVQFYLQYIEELAEQETKEEILDSGRFGNILHKAIELLYTDLIGQELTVPMLKEKHHQVEAMLQEAFRKEEMSYDELSGENLLAYDVILEAIHSLIQLDIQSLETTPFKMLDLEGSFERTLYSERFGELRFKGKIDRLDEVYTSDGEVLLRVLDYKSGKIELEKGKNIEQALIDVLFKRHNNKLLSQVFQGLFYLFLLESDRAVAGFYSLRKLKDGMKMLNEGQPVEASSLQHFEGQLLALMEEILDEEIPFTQNPDEQSYQYSPYTFIAP